MHVWYYQDLETPTIGGIQEMLLTVVISLQHFHHRLCNNIYIILTRSINQYRVFYFHPQVLPTTMKSNHAEMVWNHIITNPASDLLLVPRLGRGSKDPRQQSTKVEKLENTTSELHRTSKIIQKVYLSTKLHEFEENWKMSIFLSSKNVHFRVDLRSDNDIWTRLL